MKQTDASGGLQSVHSLFEGLESKFIVNSKVFEYLISFARPPPHFRDSEWILFISTLDRRVCATYVCEQFSRICTSLMRWWRVRRGEERRTNSSHSQSSNKTTTNNSPGHVDLMKIVDIYRCCPQHLISSPNVESRPDQTLVCIYSGAARRYLAANESPAAPNNKVLSETKINCTRDG